MLALPFFGEAWRASVLMNRWQWLAKRKQSAQDVAVPFPLIGRDEPLFHDQREAMNELTPQEYSGRMLQADMAEAVMHLFNNLFNNLVLQLEVLKRTESSEATAGLAATLQQKAREMADLLKKLNRFGESRQPRGEMLDLNRVLCDLVGQGQEGQWPVPVVLELDAGVPPLEGWRFDLTRLVELLLGHATAVTANPDTVLVRTEKTANGCLLAVDDKGPSVNGEELHRLFEPFTIVRPGSDDWTLPICKVLARRLQGVMRAENRPEGGMSFRIDFDLEKRATKPAPPR